MIRRLISLDRLPLSCTVGVTEQGSSRLQIYLQFNFGAVELRLNVVVRSSFAETKSCYKSNF